jgi:hypothetical protein
LGAVGGGRAWLVDIAAQLQVLYGNTTWIVGGYGSYAIVAMLITSGAIFIWPM